MSYMPVSQASICASKMLEQNYEFTMDNIFDMDGFVSESVLSKTLSAYFDAGNDVTKEQLSDLEVRVSKAAFTKAFLACKEEFTPDDLTEFELSLSKAAIQEVCKSQGNIKYDDWDGFSYIE